jgi:carboxymethylenebutenolidase
VPFYGTPLPSSDQIDAIKTPVLAIYAETDRTLTRNMAPVMTDMINKQKTFGFHVYQGAGHAFNNDTGAAYNPEAACDAWARTIAWFNKFLYKA